MKTILILSAIFGIYSGYDTIRKTRNGIYRGVKPSRNLFSFLFLDDYA